MNGTITRVEKSKRGRPMSEEERVWIDSSPTCVQGLCEEFPPRSVIWIDDIPKYVAGYTEDDRLILSPVDPYDSVENYQQALRSQEYLCASHVRDFFLRN